MQDQEDMASQGPANSQGASQRPKKQLTLKHGVTMRVRKCYIYQPSGAGALAHSLQRCIACNISPPAEYNLADVVWK